MQRHGITREKLSRMSTWRSNSRRRKPSSRTSSSLAALRVNTVVGTTGWAKDFDRVRTAVE